MQALVGATTPVVIAALIVLFVIIRGKVSYFFRRMSEIFLGYRTVKSEEYNPVDVNY